MSACVGGKDGIRFFSPPLSLPMHGRNLRPHFSPSRERERERERREEGRERVEEESEKLFFSRFDVLFDRRHLRREKAKSMVSIERLIFDDFDGVRG